MFDRFRQFFGEARGELKRVNWPNRETMKSFTSVVLVALLILGFFLYLVDTVLGYIFDLTIYRREGIGAFTTAGLRMIASEWFPGFKWGPDFLSNLMRLW